MRIFGKEYRDKDGKMKDSPVEKFKSWWLGRQIRKGNIPRGRTISMEEGHQAVSATTYSGIMTEVYGFLGAKVIRADGTIEDRGLISVKKVTTAFRDRIVDSLQNQTTTPIDTFKYHGSGTGTTAEANTDTALVTEVETRATGTQTEGASANIYRSIGTVSYTASRAVTEHGLFSASTSGTLMDRSVFAAINVGNGDSIQFTYEITFNAEA